MTVPWKKIKSRSAYRNHWIDLREDRVIRPDGRPGMYAFMKFGKTGKGSSIVGLTEEKKILLVKIFRYPVGKWLLEIPKGMSDNHEIPIKTAKREFEEETGYRASRWDLLGSGFSTPGLSTELTYFYLARGLKPGKRKVEFGEKLKLVSIPVRQAFGMVADGRIRDTITIAALLSMKQYLHL